MRLWRSGLVLALLAVAGPIAAQQPPAKKTYGPEYMETAEAAEVCAALFWEAARRTPYHLTARLMRAASEKVTLEHDRRSPLSKDEDVAAVNRRLAAIKAALSDGRLTENAFDGGVHDCNNHFKTDVFAETAPPEMAETPRAPAQLTPAQLAECEAMPEQGLAMLSQYKSNLERRYQGDQQLSANYCAAANDMVNEAVKKSCPIEVQRVLVRMSSEAQRLLDTANAGSSYKWACKTTY